MYLGDRKEMIMKTTMTVMVTFDLDKVNDALGNTPNVSAQDALTELLKSAVYEYGLRDNYGDECKNAPHLENHVSFEVL